MKLRNGSKATDQNGDDWGMVSMTASFTHITSTSCFIMFQSIFATEMVCFPTVPPKILRQVTGKLHLFAELARPISRISGVGPREGQSRHSWSSHSVAAQGVMGEQWLNQTSGCRYNIYLRVYDISIFITYNYIYAIQRVYIYIYMCVCISLATYI